MREKRDDEEDMKDDLKEEIKINFDFEKEPEYILAPRAGFDPNNMNLNEIIELQEEQRELLQNKRKRKEKKLKRLPLQISKTKNRRIEPSVFQKIFNDISKMEVLSENGIIETARKLNYQLDKQNVNFFMEIGKAKVSIKKYGLPGNICKHPFHVFAFLPFYDTCSIFTNDKVVWNFYYSQIFTDRWKVNLLRFADLYKDSKVLDFSIISDSVFSCTKMFSGYVQDYLKTVTVISDRPITNDNEKRSIIADLDSGKDAIIIPYTTPTGGKFRFIQYKSMIMCASIEQKFETLLNGASKIKCINSKNKLSDGLKPIKVNEKIGTYFNLHDAKVTDFIPSCLFFEPAVKNVKFFVNAILDTNTVYNEIEKNVIKYKTLMELPLPDNAVFWDNISSYVQLIALYKVTLGDALSPILSKYISDTVEIYYKYKDIFSAWKRVYKQFESITLSFYDSVTSRLTIDGILRLQTKVTEFLGNYTYLKNDNSIYEPIRKFFAQIPGIKMINNFLITNIPYELATSISKLIIILRTGKKNDDDKTMTIENMFRTIGILCTKVMFNGDYPIIPKVRSQASFLGNIKGELTDENVKNNIQYLVSSFVKKLKEIDYNMEKEMFVNVNIGTMYDIIDRMIENSAKKLNNAYLTANLVDFKNKVKTDKTLFESLFNDVKDLLKLEDQETIMAYGDFLENSLFNSFIKAFGQLGEVMYNGVDKVDFKKILESINIKPKAKRLKLRKIRKKKQLADLPTDMPIDKVVTVDKDILLQAINGANLRKDQTKEAVFNGMEAAVKEVLAN